MQDAHLHLQDTRFSDILSIVTEMLDAGVEQCVVNGTGPDDWEQVAALARKFPALIIPSYGLHPWKTPQQGEGWKTELVKHVNSTPLACVGECGLDRWMQHPDTEAQEDAFLFQLALAEEMNRPLSVHVLKAWGWFLELLRAHPFPQRGFLLHSYNGSKELLPELIAHGAYFSFSGYYLQERKTKQQVMSLLKAH